MIRRTKISCTIGPAVSSRQRLQQLVDSGMDVARLNFSYSDYEKFAEIIADLRSIAITAGRPISIMADIQGPKIRVGRLRGGVVEVNENSEVWIRSDVNEGGAEGKKIIIPTTYSDFVKDVEVGNTIILSDGFLELKAVEKNANGLRCEVIDGGTLKQNKGINAPDVSFSVPSITEKDYADVRFCLEQGIDFIALSFVRSAEDVRQLKEFIASNGKRAQVIAKIEKREALNVLEDIIRVSDGILIARGDLAIEVGNEVVPVLQKKITRQGNVMGKTVIVATQMLMSMVENPRPTRAEASDVANAILDGVDVLMLTNETAVGKYPIESLQMMSKIVEQMEAEPPPPAVLSSEWKLLSERQTEMAVVQGAVRLASMVRAKLIVVVTQSGNSALLLSKCRPATPVLVVTSDRITYHQLAIKWGVAAIFMEDMEAQIGQTSLFEAIAQRLRALNLCGSGDKIVITAGLPHLAHGSTNTVKIQLV